MDSVTDQDCEWLQKRRRALLNHGVNTERNMKRMVEEGLGFGRSLVCASEKASRIEYSTVLIGRKEWPSCAVLPFDATDILLSGDINSLSSRESLLHLE
jgi:hypothetical protein